MSASHLAADRWGNLLTEVTAGVEGSENPGRPANATVVVRRGAEYLMIFNRHRRAWELPGGGMEPGETPRECAIREMKEETGQVVADLKFRGVVTLLLKPDKESPDWRPQYGALFDGSVEDLAPFSANDEVSEIRFWDLKSNIGYVNPIDRALIDWLRR